MNTQFQCANSVTEDRVEVEINQTINRLIDLLNLRRIDLLTEYRDKREEMRVDNGEKAEELSFLCDTREFEVHISRLGDISSFDIISTAPLSPVPKPSIIPQIPTFSPNPPISSAATIPDYARFDKPVFSFGKKGSAPGQFNLARGISIGGVGRIHVADMANHRIQIFSERGDLINHFGYQDLKLPMGILAHDESESLYVTDCGHHGLFKFALTELTVVKRVGKEGSGRDEFNSPGQLAISPNQLLHIADEDNNRIQVLNCNLDFQSSLTHQSMTRPVDVKFSTEQMLVLSYKDNPCVHVFSLSGAKIRSFITRGGIGMQVRGTCFFCVDARNNIIISDCSANNIKVFSYDGNLLQTIGEEGHKPGMFFLPYGVAILDNAKLFCISQNKQCALQIYST